MSSKATPFGAEPIGCLSAAGSFTGKVRHMPITNASATAIYYGDFVKRVSGGTVEKAVVTTGIVAGTIGVFLGCHYTDPSTKQKTFSQYWPAGNTAADPLAVVADDPHLIFKMQANGTVAATAMGLNCTVVSTAGNATFGRSRNAVTGSTVATNNTFPLRIVDFVYGPDSKPGDAFTDLICMFVPTSHAYQTLLGV